MKTKLLLALAAAINTALAADSNLAIDASASGTSIKVTDAANRSWKIQSSSDFANWSAYADIKVHNGHFTMERKPLESGNVFFRATQSAAALPANVIDALLLPPAPFNYANPTLPPAFLVAPIINQDNTPAGNPTTDPGATLGRVLFYDKRLSRNQTISCASCHQQGHGFSDPRKFSLGFEGGETGRNSMGLSNARYYLRRHFFWDERANTLEDQVLQPIQNAVEMGMTLADLRARLAAEPYYTNLFTQVFGDAQITDQRISRALAQFVRSIISVESKYDAGVRQNFANFTAQENLGRRIYTGQTGRINCAACHGTDNFVPGPNIFNNGLENPYVDKGVGALTGLARDEGLFKVGSLRNIELTAPYMHDGRFATLEQVVDFYSTGVVNHPNLSPQLRAPGGPGQPPGPPVRPNFTAAEKAALVAFMKTLTDPNLATNPKYSDPFNYGE